MQVSPVAVRPAAVAAVDVMVDAAFWIWIWIWISGFDV